MSGARTAGRGRMERRAAEGVEKEGEGNVTRREKTEAGKRVQTFAKIENGRTLPI
jgi:hypothetical protein